MKMVRIAVQRLIRHKLPAQPPRPKYEYMTGGWQNGYLADRYQ